MKLQSAWHLLTLFMGNLALSMKLSCRRDLRPVLAVMSYGNRLRHSSETHSINLGSLGVSKKVMVPFMALKLMCRLKMRSVVLTSAARFNWISNCQSDLISSTRVDLKSMLKQKHIRMSFKVSTILLISTAASHLNGKNNPLSQVTSALL